jgi:hypothetical protein
VTPFILAGVLLIVAYYAIRWFAKTPPKRLISDGRTALGLLALGAAVLFGLTGRMGLAVPLAMGGVSLLGAGGLPSFGRRTTRTPGSNSTVRSSALEMTLEHDTGKMRGRVLTGAYAGRQLDDLAPAHLLALHTELSQDPDSRALLEAYLDRRSPGWRENLDRDATARQGGTSNAGAMSEQEAYEILGLGKGAGEPEVRAAHRRLMKAVHPDQGGSTYLAARINAAKERLLQQHR